MSCFIDLVLLDDIIQKYGQNPKLYLYQSIVFQFLSVFFVNF